MEIGAGGRDQAAGIAGAEGLLPAAGIGTETVAREGLAEPYDAADLAGGDFLDGSVAGAGIEADFGGFFCPEGFALRGFEGQEIAGFQGSAGNTQEGQACPLGIPGDLVDPGTENGGGHGAGIEAGEEIQEGFHAFVPQGGTGEQGKHLSGGDQGMKEPEGDFALPEIGVEAGFIAEGQLFRIGGRKFNNLIGQLAAKGGGKGLRIVGKVGFIQKENDGDVPLLQEAPEGSGVGLDAVGGADDQDGGVEHIQGALGFAGKIGMAGGVHEGQVRAVPGEAGFLGKDGDAPVLFHGIGIQKGVAVIHATLAAQGSGKEEYGLRKGGFARVHMGTKPDDRSCCHGFFLL
jgi:hypothetical protein